MKDSYGFTLRIVVNTMIITVHIVLTPMEKLIEHGWVAMLMIPAEFTRDQRKIKIALRTLTTTATTLYATFTRMAASTTITM